MAFHLRLQQWPNIVDMLLLILVLLLECNERQCVCITQEVLQYYHFCYARLQAANVLCNMRGKFKWLLQNHQWLHRDVLMLLVQPHGLCDIQHDARLFHPCQLRDVMPERTFPQLQRICLHAAIHYLTILILLQIYY